MSHSLQAEDIKPGKLYRAKNPSKSIYGGIVGDRRVVWISSDRNKIEYLDTAFPQNYKPLKTSMHRFLKWAEHEVYESGMAA